MLKEIFFISNYPHLERGSPFANKLVTFFKTYGLLLLVMIAIGPVLILADKFVTHVLHHKSLNDQNREMFKQLYKKAGMFNAFLFICIIGPIFEELIFRFPLSFKKRQVAITLLIAVFYFAGAFVHPKIIMMKVAVEIAIALIIAGLCIAFIPDTPLNMPEQRKRQLIITSMCLFALMHVANYRPMDWALIWIYPIYVLPQLLLGWGITYVRFKNGFVWGIALHCLINTVSTLLAYLIKGSI
ncbi:MAG: CPBP family glutamic-type intramembrane protease [Bacteroidota bacterium]